MSQNENGQRSAATYRTVELAVAAIALLFGLGVMIESWRLGARWADDGPQAGYFPFYVALVVAAASAWILWTEWSRRHQETESFVTHGQLRQILALLIPAAAYAIAIGFAGIYLASCVFLAYFMARHGAHRWWSTAAVALGLPLVLFMMFEVWFRTPLPKGPVEAMLGLA